ncbi:MAG: DUF349 domain-containing protein [Nitrospinota bacterium]
MVFKNFFKPKWQHKNPDIRLTAVQELDDSELATLTKIITKESDPRVSRAALDKVHDQKTLKELLRLNISQEFQEIVKSRLTDFQLEKILAISDEDFSKDFLDGIKDPKVLIEIAVNAQSPKIRVEAVHRINSPEELCKVVLQECGKLPALAAINKIEDKEILKRIKNKAASRIARYRATEKLEGETPKKISFKEEKNNEKRLEQLVTEAEEASQSSQWETTKKRFFALRGAWKSLDPEMASPLFGVFEESEKVFSKRYEEHLSQKEKEEHSKKIEQERSANLKAICSEIENMQFNTGGSPETRYEELRSQAESILKNEDKGTLEKELLKERFHKACDWFRRNRELHIEDRQNREAVERECTRLENNSTGRDFEESYLKLKKMVDTHPLESEDTASLMERFEGLTKKFEGFQVAREEERKSQLGELQCIVDEIKELAESKPGHRKVSGRVKELQIKWKSLPKQPDDEFRKISDSFRKGLQYFTTKKREFMESEDWERWANKNLKEELCEAVEALNKVNDLEVVAQKVKEAQARWKTIGAIPQNESQSLWDRFREACEQNFERCKPYLQEMETKRAQSLVRKKEICAEAKELSQSREWKETAKKLKALQAEWRELAKLGKVNDGDLYKDFSSACNSFFEVRRVEYLDRLEEKRIQNLKEKEQICLEVEKMVETPQWQMNREIQKFQKTWQKIGAVPKKNSDTIWKRFRAACDSFYEWLETQLPTHLKQKEALCEKLKALLEISGDNVQMSETAKKIAALQKEWNQIGPVPEESKEDLRNKFNAPCDEFFEKRKKQLGEIKALQEKNRQKKEELLVSAEKLLETGDHKTISSELKNLQEQWKKIDHAPKGIDRALNREFNNLCTKYFEGRREWFQEMKKIRNENLKKRETLCFELEQILGIGSKVEKGERKNNALTLAEELKIALESNIIMAGQRDDRQAIGNEVRRLQNEWKNIGSVPREFDRETRDRFRNALDVFYGENKKTD